MPARVVGMNVRNANGERLMTEIKKLFLIIEGNVTEEEKKKVIGAAKNLLKILADKPGVGNVEWEVVEHDILQQEDMP